MGIKSHPRYSGFEQGPIRPPSEAYSLLIRITRNCPWNRCTFCPAFKHSTFSLRPVEHVIADIDAVYNAVTQIKDALSQHSILTSSQVHRLVEEQDITHREAFYAAANWINNGEESIFLQDANSLIIKPDDLIHILQHLSYRFPNVQRITSYARSHTINKISDDKLQQMAEAGLNRLHLGLESGSDKVLQMTKKGATKAVHIAAGQKVKRTSIELSEYIMPGMGGKELSMEHALETADALNQINPDFIRLRTLAIHPDTELHNNFREGQFSKCGERDIIEEIYTFIDKLDGISSTLKSDHILNLFQELEGRFPDDKDALLLLLHEFITLPRKEQMLFQVGRRIGVFHHFSDLTTPDKRHHVETICQNNDISPDNVDKALENVTQQLIR